MQPAGLKGLLVPVTTSTAVLGGGLSPPLPPQQRSRLQLTAHSSTSWLTRMALGQPIPDMLPGELSVALRMRGLRRGPIWLPGMWGVCVFPRHLKM